MTSKTWTCDIETDGIEATKIWCIVVQDVDTKEIKTFVQGEIHLFNQWLGWNVDTMVFHNGISYDVPVLERLLHTDFSGIQVEDTMIMSMIDNPAREGGHSLASWGERFRFSKGDHEDWSKFSQEMLEYCVRDVEITTQLYLQLREKVDRYRDALELEYAIKKSCAKQERDGWYFDIEGAYKLLPTLDHELREAEFEVQSKFVPLPVWVKKNPVKNKFKKDGTRTQAYEKEVALECHTNEAGEYGYFDYQPIKLGSRKQIAMHLMHYGWKPSIYTEAGNVVVDEKTLADVEIPEAKLILRYLMLQKRRSQVQSWIDAYNEDTHCIHGRVHTIGTVTNRMSSSNPNLQQVTASSKEFGEEMRSLFAVHPNKVLVGADLSGLELRCLAHYMNDPAYTEEILSGDIHTANQKAAGLNTRNEAKRFIYAYLYGGGDKLIGEIVGGNSTDGKNIKQQFLDNTPALATLRTRVEAASKRGYIKALDGRRIKIRSAHSALNFLLQSAGSIIAKRAWVIFHEKCKLPYTQLGVIHDEIQIECAPEHADEIGKAVVDAMEATTEYYNLRCPITGEYQVGETWAQTH